MKMIFMFLLSVFSCAAPSEKPKQKIVRDDLQATDTATFAGGCFWCIEASFESLEGVVEVISGYSGGDKKNADYKKVSTGTTKHAEAVQVYYDRNVIDYKALLDVFFIAHDPTQVNRQGPDHGPQYRSEIFYHNDAQKQLALEKIKNIQSSYDKPIATLVSAIEDFFVAEDYHQDFEKNNPNHPYIVSVSRPKIDKVKRQFKELLKK